MPLEWLEGTGEGEGSRCAAPPSIPLAADEGRGSGGSVGVRAGVVLPLYPPLASACSPWEEPCREMGGGWWQKAYSPEALIPCPPWVMGGEAWPDNLAAAAAATATACMAKKSELNCSGICGCSGLVFDCMTCCDSSCDTWRALKQ